MVFPAFLFFPELFIINFSNEICSILNLSFPIHCIHMSSSSCKHTNTIKSSIFHVKSDFFTKRRLRRNLKSEGKILTSLTGDLSFLSFLAQYALTSVARVSGTRKISEPLSIMKTTILERTAALVWRASGDSWNDRRQNIIIIYWRLPMY